MNTRESLEKRGMQTVAIPDTDSLVRSNRKLPEMMEKYGSTPASISEEEEILLRIEGAIKRKGARNFHPR